MIADPDDWYLPVYNIRPIHSEYIRLYIARGGYLTIAGPMPSWWHRFWARLLLGFRWERSE